jgi:hypothetical protein
MEVKLVSPEEYDDKMYKLHGDNDSDQYEECSNYSPNEQSETDEDDPPSSEDEKTDMSSSENESRECCDIF